MGNTLSGGEQQMLAIGRALMTNPEIADPRAGRRAGLGAADKSGDLGPPVHVEGAQGQSILVIDKNVGNLTRICDRHYIIERGRTVWSGHVGVQLVAEPDLYSTLIWDLTRFESTMVRVPESFGERCLAPRTPSRGEPFGMLQRPNLDEDRHHRSEDAGLARSP